MQLRRVLFPALVGALCLAALSLQAADRPPLFQTSTLQALMGGVYDGDLTMQELARHGDFGLGTFDALDGEMIGLDGVFYQIKADGRVYPTTGAMKTPFAEVTFFKPATTITLPRSMTYKELTDHITGVRPTANLPYALRVEGVFSAVKVRSVPRQQQPYPPLAEVAKQQEVFELTNVRGVIVGFWHPAFLAGVNLAGYHCHFITADRRAGGHLLDCRVEQGSLALDPMAAFFLRLPQHQAFLQAELAGDYSRELEKVEK